MNSLTHQELLSEILRSKGIGPETSKSLKEEQIEQLKPLLKHKDVSLTTKATFITALLTLPPNEVEKQFIDEIIKEPEQFIPHDLFGFLDANPVSPFQKLINRVVANNDLTEDEAQQAMDYFLDENQPEFLKASFLEAERLKRETFSENKVFFEKLWNEIEHSKIPTSILIDLADSYDGCNRNRHFSVFVASLIASAGFPVYLHGVDNVAPKEAVTSHQILRSAGKNPLKSKSAIIEDLLNPEIRWGYVDQQIYFPKLFALKKMRKEMVKRPFLATFEKLLQPFQAINGNLMVTGYTHAHYKEELVNQLQKQGQCNQALVLKGVEGSTQVTMSRHTTAIHFDGRSVLEKNISPEEYGFNSYTVPRDMSITPAISLHEGELALKGEKGFARENILYTSTLIIDHLGLMKKMDIKPFLEKCMDSGLAMEHWQKGCL